MKLSDIIKIREEIQNKIDSYSMSILISNGGGMAFRDVKIEFEKFLNSKTPSLKLLAKALEAELKYLKYIDEYEIEGIEEHIKQWNTTKQ